MKTIFNIVTIIFISISSLSAGYVPLTDSSGHEKSWVLFGVTGLKITGAGAGSSAGSFSIKNLLDINNNPIVDTSRYTIIDTTKDDNFEKGLFVDENNSFAKVKLLSNDYIQVRVDTSKLVVADLNDTVYSMYVTMEENSGASFVITYSASLENKVMEYTRFSDNNETNVYSVTLNSFHSYNNPAYGKLVQYIPSLTNGTLSLIRDSLDFNLSDNPPNSTYYEKNRDQKVATVNDFLRVYSYDAENGRWNLFDTRNSDSVNDMLEFEKGKAYWAQMDGPANTQAGLVFANDTLSKTEYTNILQTGWNLISFSNENSSLKDSSTGLIVTITTTEGNIKIWNGSGNYSIGVSGIDGGDDAKILQSCLNINQAIKQAEINSTLPQSFHLTAFPIDTTKIALLSNQRFIIDEDTTDTLSAITTLTGAIPYKVNPDYINNITDTQEMNSSTVLDTDSYGAMSKYGEYSLIIEPLLGSGTASEFSAKLQIQKSSDINEATPIMIETNTTTVVNNINNIGFTATPIDTDYNSSTEIDKIIISSEEPFFIKDYTFSRVFKYTNIDTDAELIVSGIGDDVAINIDGDNNSSAVAGKIRDANAGVYAKEIGDKIVIFSTETDAVNFTISEDIDISGKDQFENNQTDSDLAKGAIKGVYSLNSLVQTPVNTILTIKFDEFIDNADDNMSVLFRTILGKKVVASDTIGIAKSYAVPDDDPSAQKYVADIEQQIKDELAFLHIEGTVVTTDFNGSLSDENWTVTITSQDIENVSVDYTNGGGDSETDIAESETPPKYGTLDRLVPDLSSDLKFSALYTPEYKYNGPLDRMKDAGFDMKSMVTGSVDISDGSISWKSIDLTRDSSEWFSSLDYTLFSTDASAGYWVYLEPSNAGEQLGIDSSVLKAKYNSTFNINGITYNNFYGKVFVEINSAKNLNVTALINGNDVAMKKSSTSNVYFTDINAYELEILPTSNYSISINASDGQGLTLLNQSIGKEIDFIKPSKPIIDIKSASQLPGDNNNDSGTTVTFNSSADVTGFYVFNGQIPDYNPLNSLNKFAEFSKTDTDQYSLCSMVGMNKLITADQEAYHLNIIAVDGTGKLGGGNASDITVQSYIPILKNAIKLHDIDNNESDGQKMGKIYDSNCKYSANQSIDYGIEIRSEDIGETVKIVYEPKNADLTGTPITLFFSAGNSDNNITARVIYAKGYKDNIVYLDVNDTVYSYKLIDTGNTKDNPIWLDTNDTVTKRPDQKL